MFTMQSQKNEYNFVMSLSNSLHYVRSKICATGKRSIEGHARNLIEDLLYWSS